MSGYDYQKNIMGSYSVIRWSPAGLKIKRMLRVLPEQGRVLEVGCGAANLLYAVQGKRPSYWLTGIDLSLDALKRARAKSGGESVDFVAADAASLPIEDASFDIVYAIDLIEHVPDHKAALDEMIRVLKKDGYLHLYVPCEANPFTFDWMLTRIGAGEKLKEKWYGHLHKFTGREVLELLKQRGLVITDIKYDAHPFWQFFGFVLGVFSWEVRSRLTGKVESSTPLAKGAKSRPSLLKRIVRPFWSIILRVLYLIAYVESSLLGSVPVAGAVEVTARKQGWEQV